MTEKQRISNPIIRDSRECYTKDAFHDDPINLDEMEIIAAAANSAHSVLDIIKNRKFKVKIEEI